MGWEHEPDKVWEAEELYCIERLSYRVVAERSGVAESSLKRWGDKYAWAAKREEIRRVRAEIRANTVRLRGRLIKECLDAGDTKAINVFAAAKMEEMALKAEQWARKSSAAPPDPPPDQTPLRPITTMGEAAAALEEAVTLKLNRLLVQPEIVDFSTIKDLKQALELIATLKPAPAASAAETAKAKPAGISVATAEEIRNKILGLG